MLAELLLVLSGHPSAFFIPSTSQAGHSTITISPKLAEYLHPGEVASLNDLGHVAHQYRKIRVWAASTQQKGREAVLASSASVKGKARAEEALNDVPDQYMSTLASGLLDILQEYELLIVELEAKVLQLDSAVVQDADGYVPLTTLTAALSPWRAPLASLVGLVDRLTSPPTDNERWTPGALLELIDANTHTGNPHLAQIYNTLLAGLRHLFLTHLVTFLLFGVAPQSSPPTSPAIALDVGSDPLSPKHRQYRLNGDLFPAAVTSRTRESILYVGRVAATLQRENRSLPQTTVAELREEIIRSQRLDEGGDLDLAINRARREVGEWLWRHVLTGPHVANALESFGEYFLTRNGEFSTNLIREITRLRLQKLITSNPHSSSSVIREQDLSLAILRAAAGTNAENDRQLEKLRFRLPRGPLRPIMPALSASTRGTPRLGTDDNQYAGGQSVRDLFSSFLLGSPLELETVVAWPLDLFMTPASVSAYGDINAYLLALRETHLQVLNCWTSLSAAQRQRRKWTGANEGGTAEEMGARQSLARTAWGAVRAMLFFLDQLQSHFMVDIIAVQHKRLLAELDGVNVRQSESEAGSLRGSTATRPQSPIGTGRPTPTLYASSVVGGRPVSPASTHGWDNQTVRSRAPPTPGRPQAHYLDFLTLRRMHTRHLAFLKEGLLISDRTSAALVRDVLLTCKRFTGLVERWGGDVLPELLFDTSVSSGKGDLVQERAAAVDEIVETLREHMVDFFRLLVDSQNPSLAGDTSSNGTATRTASRAALLQVSRVFARQTSFTGVSKAKIPSSGSNATGIKDKAKAAKEEKDLEAEALMGRHIEQLLLRLDFNGVLTAWLAKEDQGGQTQHLLAEGGLSPLPRSA